MDLEKKRASARAAMKRWYTKPENKAKVQFRRQAWREKNYKWDLFCKTLLRHKLTLDQYAAKDENQDWACAICGRDDVQRVVDHNHKTDERRGLLCWSCNSGFGQFKESPVLLTRAIAYAERWI